MYGSRWTAVQPETPTKGWLVALRDLTPADVGNGLDALVKAGTDWPPSATEFRRLCRPAKREHGQAYKGAPRQLRHMLSEESRAKGRKAVAAAKRAIKP